MSINLKCLQCICERVSHLVHRMFDHDSPLLHINASLTEWVLQVAWINYELNSWNDDYPDFWRILAINEQKKKNNSKNESLLYALPNNFWIHHLSKIRMILFGHRCIDENSALLNNSLWAILQNSIEIFERLYISRVIRQNVQKLPIFTFFHS